MKFEHLIEINNPANPLLDEMTRLQLWRGLVLRAEQPELFISHLDACEILARSAEHLQRRLRFGELVLLDQVSFIPQLQVSYSISAQGEIPDSRLVMRIEEPSPQHLFVRFSYDSNTTPAQDEANEMYDDYRRSAYKAADIDTIKLIRQFVAEGQLG